MPTAARRTQKRATPQRATSQRKAPAQRGETDAVDLLMADHKKVKGLFNQFKKLKKDGAGNEEKETLVRTICEELRIHTAL